MTDADDREMEYGGTGDEDWDGATARSGGPDGGEPDVLLDVPELRVEEISLEVQDLQARVSLQADVLELLKLHVGVDAELGSVQLTIKGVEAKVLLKVHLDNVARILDRVLTTIDNNPEIVERLVEHLGEAVEGVGSGAGRAVGDLGASAGSAVEEVGAGAGTAVGEVGESAGTAVEELGDDGSDDDTGEDADPPRRTKRDAAAQPRRKRSKSAPARTRKTPRSSRGRAREES
jgi:hypothetical protein